MTILRFHSLPPTIYTGRLICPFSKSPRPPPLHPSSSSYPDPLYQPHLRHATHLFRVSGNRRLPLLNACLSLRVLFAERLLRDESTRQ